MKQLRAQIRRPATTAARSKTGELLSLIRLAASMSAFAISGTRELAGKSHFGRRLLSLSTGCLAGTHLGRRVDRQPAQRWAGDAGQQLARQTLGSRRACKTPRLTRSRRKGADWGRPWRGKAYSCRAGEASRASHAMHVVADRAMLFSGVLCRLGSERASVCVVGDGCSLQQQLCFPTEAETGRYALTVLERHSAEQRRAQGSLAWRLHARQSRAHEERERVSAECRPWFESVDARMARARLRSLAALPSQLSIDRVALREQSAAFASRSPALSRRLTTCRLFLPLLDATLLCRSQLASQSAQRSANQLP